MEVQANNVCVSLDAMLPGREQQRQQEIAHSLGVKPARLTEMHIVRQAVDARKRADVHFVLNVHAEIDGLHDLAELHPKKGVQVMLPKVPAKVAFPDLSALAEAPSFARPLIVGAGPAGLFCALALARAGLRPLLIERGRAVEERACDVRTFAEGGPLDAQSNIQFGEGGAGTFSDGKLNTGTKSPYARFVLESFVAAGAPPDILTDAKPHIGTDYLPRVVQNLRMQILKAGGEVRFSTQLMDLQECQRVTPDGTPTISVRLRDLSTGDEHTMTTSALILGIGHSARDTFAMLHEAGVTMTRKPFAVGVRIEHEQSVINEAQYGPSAGHPALPPADYKLAVHTREGRGVYTFCMCPGGSVVAAASEAGGVCVNGMSNHARDGKNANSALLVEVATDDFAPEEGVLAGVRFQQALEQVAFQMGNMGYAAPAQTVGSFLSGESGSVHSGSSDPCAPVHPTYPRGVRETDLHDVLPSFVTDALEEALVAMGRKLRGFDAPSAVMTAVEARSSSPVRIVRDAKTLRSVSHPCVYPAGEGAGYAGGIMSAACDGLRVACAVMEAAQLDVAADALKRGLPAVFPTDTVAGIGVAVRAATDASLLARIKGRDADKPVAWLVDSLDALDIYGANVPDYARALAQEDWPGALTLIVQATDAVPRAFQSAEGTIGLRMPSSPEALHLIELAGSPLATTSANLAGEPAPRAMAEVSPAFLAQAKAAGVAILDFPVKGSGRASRVVDCTGPEPVALRG